MSFNSYLPNNVAELVEQLGLIPHPEGGFFLETHRSASVPMASRGQTDFTVVVDGGVDGLVTVAGREHCRPDHSNQRNGLTSIYWVPTVNSPSLPLVANLSDHVHYYQGGRPFQYYIYNPTTANLRSLVLGPNLAAGHQLQVPVASGEWKCGRLLVAADDTTEGGLSSCCCPDILADYSIVGEAVGPGFDFHDFHHVDKQELLCTEPSPDVIALLLPFLYAVEGFDEYYNNDTNQALRTKDRI